MTDHLAAARANLDNAVGMGYIAAAWVARAQVHATLAVAEETRTANLLAALDYGHVHPDKLPTLDHCDEIIARLWPNNRTDDLHAKLEELVSGPDRTVGMNFMDAYIDLRGAIKDLLA